MGFRLAGTPGPTGVPAWFLRSWRVRSLPACCHLHLQNEVKIKYLQSSASSLAALLKFGTLFVFSNTSANLWGLLKLRGRLADITRSVPCLYLGLSLPFSGNKEFV